MSPWQRSAWRRRFQRSRSFQAAVTAAIAAVVVAAAVGGMSLLDQHDQSASQAAYSGCARSSADPVPSGGGQPAPSGSASAAPCPAQSSGAATPDPSASAAGDRVLVAPDTFSSGPIASRPLGDVATQPVDGTGAAISLRQSGSEADASGNCTLSVPANPLTAVGLAAPYVIGDGCTEADPDEQAFVEATILSPTGAVKVYDPLVVTRGTRPAARPAAPSIPRGAKVIIDFGSNGTNLVLTGPGARQRASGCVDALGQSVIGQVAACDAVPFYTMANAEIARGTLKVPALGTSLDGQACQTSRDFALIDQDQSDNTYTQYLLTASGKTAQATAANQAALPQAALVSNGSDNALLGDFVDPANGCTPFTKSDPTSPSGTQSSQALDELSARVNQQAPVAVVPTNDEMALVGGGFSIAKTNMYRSLVDQPQIAANTNPYEVAAAYCMNMVNVAPARNQLDLARDTPYATPVPGTGDNLATFLGNRLSMSFDNLSCGDYGLTDPVDVTANASGAATAVGYRTSRQQATLPAAEAGSGAPSPGHGGSGGTWRAPRPVHSKGRKRVNPSGM